MQDAVKIKVENTHVDWDIFIFHETGVRRSLSRGDSIVIPLKPESKGDYLEIQRLKNTCVSIPSWLKYELSVIQGKSITPSGDMTFIRLSAEQTEWKIKLTLPDDSFDQHSNDVVIVGDNEVVGEKQKT